MFASILVLVRASGEHFHSYSSVCKFEFASILFHVCARLCSLPFLLQVCVCFHSYSCVCLFQFLFMCLHVCVRFHYYSSMCKCVFASILVLVCSLLFLFYCFHYYSSVCKCVFASILVLVCATVCSLPF